MQKQGGGLEQQKIAKSCGQSEASVSRQVGILVDKGLIKVKGDENNKRINRVLFSSKGVILINEAVLAIEDLLFVKMRNFSSAECQAFGKLLQKF